MATAVLDAIRRAGLLAANEVESKHRRTVLGPFWIIVVHVAWVGSLFLVTSGLFGSDPASYLPYLVSSVTIWNIIAAAISGGALVYMRSVGYIQSFPFPLYTYPLQSVIANLIIFGHQSLIVLVVLGHFGLLLNVNLPLLIAAMIVLILFSLGATMVIGLLGARFRDTAPLMESISLVLFLMTPIFWQKSFLQRHHWIVDYNPLAQLLEITRGALLGQPPDAWAWGVSTVTTAVLLAIAVLSYQKFKSKIAFWTN